MKPERCFVRIHYERTKGVIMSRTNLETNEARQGERVPGMFLVLTVSTAIALLTLGIGVAVVASA